MKIGITGTPGTGKSAVCKILKKYYPVINLNQIIKDKKLYTGEDQQRNTLITDTDELIKYLSNYVKYWDVKKKTIFEGHLAHYLPLDVCIVLRTSPYELRIRLIKKGFDDAKINENVEAEALDVIL
ncbi:MAG: AAA family ATPase, partial [Methanocellales archaeon]|nr:AAA family ATPase [Methanocellales archaeon]